MSDQHTSHRIHFDGTSSALLSACGFALKVWEFNDSSAARAMVEEVKREERVSLYEATTKRWREHLIAVDLWHNEHHPKGHWDREFIAKRAKTTCEFSLTAAQMRNAALGARAISLEFARDWGWKELGYVLPGSINYYEVDIGSFAVLAASLDQELHSLCEHPC
jgi:hypothetical protein